MKNEQDEHFSEMLEVLDYNAPDFIDPMGDSYEDHEIYCISRNQLQTKNAAPTLE